MALVFSEQLQSICFATFDKTLFTKNNTNTNITRAKAPKIMLFEVPLSAAVVQGAAPQQQGAASTLGL
jgi:hypothetical protein